MRAAIFPEKGASIEVVDDFEKPTPGPGEVLIKVKACGLCHSDVTGQYDGIGISKYPLIPGHEIAGIVVGVGVGEGVSNRKEGDRVGVGWFGGCCEDCTACTSNVRVSCKTAPPTGVARNGGYAQFVVANANATAIIPEALSFVEAAPLACAGMTVYQALKNSPAEPGDTVAIVGIGALGHLGVQYAVKMGFNTVAISRGEYKKELVISKLGAHHYIDSKATNPGEELAKLGGAKVILVTATTVKAVEPVFSGLGLNGQLLIVAALSEPLPVNTLSLLMKRASVRVWASGDNRSIEDTYKFTALTGVRSLIEEYPLEEAAKAYERMLSTKAQFKVVLKL